MQRETRHRSRSRSKPASSHHNHNHDTAPQPLAASEDGPAKDVETMNRAIGRARRSLLRVLDTVEPGEAQKHTLQALASLQQTTSQCAHPPYQHTPPPNPHQVAAALTGVKLECAHHMMETAGPHRALVEDLLPDVRELCALVAEGAHLFHDMRWAREWAQVHRREDLAARAQELCEDTLKQLEDPANHDEDTIDNVYLQLAELETLVQQAAEAHTHAWGHPAEEDQDVAKAAHLLREEHQSDVVRQDGGTSSQPAGLAAAQPQLPLRALRTLRVLEPFLVGQERDLILQAMGDLSSWSTQFWGHPIVLTADDDHTQLDQPEDEKEPEEEGHQLVADLWQSMVESTERTTDPEDTHNRETVPLPGNGAQPSGLPEPAGEPEEGGPPQAPARAAPPDRCRVQRVSGYTPPSEPSEHRRRRAHAAADDD